MGKPHINSEDPILLHDYGQDVETCVAIYKKIMTDTEFHSMIQNLTNNYYRICPLMMPSPIFCQMDS